MLTRFLLSPVISLLQVTAVLVCVGLGRTARGAHTSMGLVLVPGAHAGAGVGALAGAGLVELVGAGFVVLVGAGLRADESGEGTWTRTKETGKPRFVYPFLITPLTHLFSPLSLI